MKSEILKDCLNVSHNARSMLLILVVLAAVIIPTTSGIEGYIFICAFLCSRMIVTTFVFDDTSKWTRYAMTTPISKRDLVAGKFVVLVIFCTVGSLFGMAVGAIVGAVLKAVSFDPVGIGELLLLTLTAWVISLIFGSISIPLVFKFGAEKGRALLLVSFLIPAAIGFVLYRLLVLLGVEITDQLIFVLLCCSPVIAFLWCCAMYQISCRIFARQEL